MPIIYLLCNFTPVPIISVLPPYLKGSVLGLPITHKLLLDNSG